MIQLIALIVGVFGSILGFGLMVFGMSLSCKKRIITFIGYCLSAVAFLCFGWLFLDVFIEIVALVYPDILFEM